jgi:hypothetical protein
MLNAKKEIKNSQCNSTIFVNKVDANLDCNVFEYFDLKVHIIVDKLDRRTKKFKQLEQRYQYFSVSFLPKILNRSLSNRISPFSF